LASEKMLLIAILSVLISLGKIFEAINNSVEEICFKENFLNRAERFQSSLCLKK